jgi:hypothetical protein
MQGLRLYFTPRSALLSFLLCSALTALQFFSPIPGPYLIMGTLIVYPYLLLIILTVAGVLPALASLMVFVAACYAGVGAGAAILALSLLLPPLAALWLSMRKRVEAHLAMAAVGLSYVAALLLLYLLLKWRMGDQLFSLLAQQVVSALDRMSNRDTFLNAFYQYGFLSLPAELADNPLVEAAKGGWTFSPAVLEEFYRQAHTRVDLWLRSLLPILISSYSVSYGVLGVYLSLRLGGRHARAMVVRQELSQSIEEVCPQLGLPPFALWHLPAQPGKILLGLGALSFLLRLSGSITLSLAGQMMYNVCSGFLMIQGLSVLEYMQRRRGLRRGFGRILMALLFVLLPTAMLILGVFDQLSDPRKLRTPRQPDGSAHKEEEK